MSRVAAGLWHNFIAVQIYGANTGVGKTVFSTLLGAHFAKRAGTTKWKVQYIKPVSTGPMNEADDRYVRRYTGESVATLFQFKEPVSPHVAARGAECIPSDEHLVLRLSDHLKHLASASSFNRDSMGIAIIETAGGVLSPGPSGTPQADIFRPMRIPVILVSDSRLGGIASTIAAAESLTLRGYDIDAVVCFDDHSRYENAAYLKSYFENLDIATFVIPWIPNLDGVGGEEEVNRMQNYYQAESRREPASDVAKHVVTQHRCRIEKIEHMAKRTQDVIWHPFTQHKHIENSEDVLVFDSAYGDYFQTKHTTKSRRRSGYHDNQEVLYPAFDGSASWWTQGLGHGNPKLALGAAYAAGRYGHVMFAGATHEPALVLAEKLLRGLSNPRLKKVFYTDNGSTATEVGIKMAIRAASKTYGWQKDRDDIGILGLKGSYHGDTIGAMDASEPCIFNRNVDWYRGRGYWFDYPTFKMRKGRWLVEPPEGMEEAFGETKYFEKLDHIFDLNRRGPSSAYETYIEETLDDLVKKQGKRFGALVMEPVILGAGGMIFVDPLFQESIVRVVRRFNFALRSDSEGQPPPFQDKDSWSGLPIVFDEVFTGLYRIGRFSSASFLQVNPDISVHAKLLTGGLIPLSVTAASRSIFEAFWSDAKSDALLHGHSYTAHPIGCHVANKSLQTMKGLAEGTAWNRYRIDWSDDEQEMSKQVSNNQSSENVFAAEKSEKGTWSMWSKEFVTTLSQSPRVDYVNALGCVLAVSLVDASGSGYSSSAASALRDALLFESSNANMHIHSRVLGNVIYLMASLSTKASHLVDVEEAFEQKLKSLE